MVRPNAGVQELPNDDSLGSYLEIESGYTQILFEDLNINEILVTITMNDSGRCATDEFILTRAGARHIADYLSHPQT